jgi:hypothetical protein
MVSQAMPLIVGRKSIPRGDAIAENCADVIQILADCRRRFAKELAKPACKPRAPYKPNQVKRDIRNASSRALVTHGPRTFALRLATRSSL